MRPDFSAIRAALFDLDGVLFLSNGAHEQAFIETLAAVGIDDFSYASIAGMRTDDALRKVFSSRGRALSEVELKQLVDDKQQRARQALAEQGKVADYSDELIDQLSQRYQLALVSSSSPRTVAIYLEKCRSPQAFALCLDGSCVITAKPSPEIYLLALKKLGLSPEEAVVIEDAVNGVRAGKAAGMMVIAVAGTDSGDALVAAGADVLAQDLRQVEQLLQPNKGTGQ